jgi:DNA-binding transcriptional LysR family regulator
LRYFVAVAETLHFGRAAERLHIAQPPLSQQIRRLEDELGVQLFQRTNRRVEVTEAGRLFLVEAARTLAQADRAAWVAVRAHRGELGRLVIGYMASAELSVFPRVLPAFRERYPDVKLTLQILAPREQLQRLRSGRLHVGFVRLPLSDRTLAIVPIWREPLVAVLPERHALARRPTVSLRELRDESFVIFPRRHAPGYYDSLMAIFRRADLAPKLVQESEKLQTILSLVAMGRGVALMPKCVTVLARTGIVCRPLQPRVPDTELGLVYDPANRSALVQTFVGLAKDILKKQRGPQVRVAPRNSEGAFGSTSGRGRTKSRRIDA